MARGVICDVWRAVPFGLKVVACRAFGQIQVEQHLVTRGGNDITTVMMSRWCHIARFVQQQCPQHVTEFIIKPTDVFIHRVVYVHLYRYATSFKFMRLYKGTAHQYMKIKSRSYESGGKSVEDDPQNISGAFQLKMLMQLMHCSIFPN